MDASGPPNASRGSGRRDFRLLWAGQSVSLLGDQFMVLALPLLAVTVLGQSAARAALLPFAFYLPFLALGLPAGAIVDRLRRRRTLLTCDAVQAVCFVAIAGLATVSALPFPLLFLLVAVSGCATVFFQVAYTSFLPQLFAEATDLHGGNARLYLSESLSRTVGPMLAGPVVALAGPVAAVAGNAGSFVVSVGSLTAIRHREPLPDRDARQRGWLVRDIREGLRFVFRHALLGPVVLCGCVYGLFLSVIEASIVLYCRDDLVLSPSAIGIVIGAAAVGFPVGNLVSARLLKRLGAPRALLVGAVVAVTGLVGVPLAASLGSVAGLVLANAVHGVGEGSFGPTALTLRQTLTPAHLLGRINSVQRFLVWGAVSVGSVIASVTIGTAGLGGAMWVGGAGTVLCLLPLLRVGLQPAPTGSEQRDATDATADLSVGPIG